MIPRDTHDGAFYRAVLALHQDLFSLAQQVSDAATIPLPPHHDGRAACVILQYVYIRGVCIFRKHPIKTWPYGISRPASHTPASRVKTLLRRCEKFTPTIKNLVEKNT